MSKIPKASNKNDFKLNPQNFDKYRTMLRHNHISTIVGRKNIVIPVTTKFKSVLQILE